MIHQQINVPTTGGASVVMDVYAPYTLRETHPDRRRPAIVVCPGGGYRYCSEREGEPIALRFAAEGFVTCVVWYRTFRREGDAPLGKRNEQSSPDVKFPMPQQDAAAAIACVRKHADAWMVDPDRIAVMGFSAGGHLAASVAGLWQRAELWQEMGLSPADVRPNAAVLCYAVLDDHVGSFINLSGGEEDPAMHQQLSVMNWVSENYPPTFLWHTFSDSVVPVQNSIRLANALADTGVLCELHVFPSGEHGLSLANEITAWDDGQIEPEVQGWVNMAARFLKTAM